MKALITALLIAYSALAIADPGLTNRDSPYSVAETLDRIEAALKAKGIKIFARIDHAAEAKSAGLELRPMQLLVFGNPKAGTPLMESKPSVGLDLPMKALAWQDESGKVHLTWNSPEYLIERHGLDTSYTKNLSAIGGLIGAALNQ